MLRSLLTGRSDPVIEGALSPVTFAVPDVYDPSLVDVPPEVVGLPSYAPVVGPVARVSAREAMQVPAFRRATDLVSTLSTLPLSVVKADRTIEATSWLQQPERDVPRSISMARLITDLAHESIAWWKVLSFDWRGYPAEVIRLDPRTVDVMPDQRVRVTTSGKRGTSTEWPTDSELIRFEMPGSGWLSDGARAIRQCLLLDAAAQRYAEGAPPGDFFTPAEGVDPGEDDEIIEMLNAWAVARRSRSTGYIPAALKYNPNPFNPEQLELADQRQHAVLEIARVTGIDPEELGVSTTSRTYSNQFDRRKQFTDFTLGQFRAAIEDRLSMADVTPRGSLVRFDLDGFLRSDALSRYQAYAAGIAVGAIDPTEVRPAEGKPALPGGTPGTTSQTPAPESTEVPA